MADGDGSVYKVGWWVLLCLGVTGEYKHCVKVGWWVIPRKVIWNLWHVVWEDRLAPRQLPYCQESAQKADPRVENYPAAPAGTRTWDLSIMCIWVTE